MLVNEQGPASLIQPTQIKVKVSYLLITDFDALLYSGVVKAKYPKTIGHAAVGVITEVGSEVLSLTKGMRVYLEPFRPCGSCLACRSGKEKNCSAPIAAGRDYDGFLRDFVVCDPADVEPLPESIEDAQALCIEAVGIAEAIFDKLQLRPGAKVAVIGMGFYGNIIAQTLMYHKVLPLAIDNNEENLKRAEKTGIFYTFRADDDLTSNIRSATSGNLCDAVIYCSSSRLPLSLAVRISASGKTVVLTSPSTFNSTMDTHEIMEKHLTLCGISSSYRYSDTAINMIMHGAINVDFFEKKILKEYDPIALLKEKCEAPSQTVANKLVILKMII